MRWRLKGCIGAACGATIAIAALSLWAAATAGYCAPPGDATALLPPRPAPLTLDDPELRAILSHFKYPEEAGPGAATPRPLGIAAIVPGRGVYALGAVRYYWPPVIVAHPALVAAPLRATAVLLPAACPRWR